MAKLNKVTQIRIAINFFVTETETYKKSIMDPNNGIILKYYGRFDSNKKETKSSS